MRCLHVFLALIISISVSQGGAVELIACRKLYSAPEAPALPAAKNLQFWGKYWWGKIKDLKNLDASGRAQIKFRTLLFLSTQKSEFAMVPVDSIELIHDSAGWTQAESKLAERAEKIQTFLRQHPQISELNRETLDQILPSKNNIRVFKMDQGGYVVFDGNGRLEALRAIRRHLKVEVEVISSSNAFLQNLVRQIQITSSNPEIQAAGRRGLNPQTQSVVMKYQPAFSVMIQEPGRNYWKKSLGLEFSNTPLIIGHRNPTETVIDWILTVSEPGERIDISQAQSLGPVVSELGRLPVLHGQAKASIAHESEMPGFDFAKIAAIPKEQQVLILRKNNQTPSALNSHPLLTESVAFNTEARGPPVTLTTGSQDLIKEMLRSQESRGQWFSKDSQVQTLDALSNNTVQAVSVRTYDPSKRRLQDPKNQQQLLFSDLMSLYVNEEQIPSRHKYQLGQGQPSIEVSRQALQTFQRRNTGIKSTEAISNFKAALENWYLERYGVRIDSDSILPTQAVSGALFDIFASLPRGSTILVPALSYPYQAIAGIFGHQLKPIPENISFKDLQKDGSEKAVLVNFPHNPSGQLMNQQHRRFLADANKAGLLVINDLTFVKNAYDGKKIESVLTGLSNMNNYLELFSTSKDIGLLEFRIGAIVGDPQWIRKIKFRTTASGKDLSPQLLATTADVLNHADSVILTKASDMQQRRDLIVDIFRQMGWPSDQIIVPEAGLNLMLKVPTDVDPVVITKMLFEKFHITSLPDIFFSDSERPYRFIRLSMSEPVEKLRQLQSLVSSSPWRIQGFKAYRSIQ